MHFLLADVHPFVDSNGRISRTMMTKELLASGLSRITIPTVWCEDYLGALRALNRYDDPGPIIRAFAFAQRVTVACVAMTVDEAIRLWASSYAFVEAGAHARLTLPQAAAHIIWRDGIPAPADFWALVEAGGGSTFAAIAPRALKERAGYPHSSDRYWSSLDGLRTVRKICVCHQHRQRHTVRYHLGIYKRQWRRLDGHRHGDRRPEGVYGRDGVLGRAGVRD